MKNKRSILAIAALTSAALAGLAGCGGTPSTSSGNSSGTSSAPHYFNVRIWNDEFQKRFRAYSTQYDHTDDNGNDVLKNGTILRWSMIENKDNKYQNALDEALAGQANAATEDKVDMFLIEADYAMKYTKGKYAMDVKKDIGLTDTDLANQYDYTKKIATYDGVLKGVSWQATPGLYAYRSDIAEEVLGTSDPDEVQEKISTWDKFNAVAAQMKAKDKHMLAGKDDSYRTYSNNVTRKWVDGDGVCTLDPNIKQWVKDTKTYADKGYLAGTGKDYALWGSEWGKQQSKAGSTFGFFWSTWGINFSLQGYADPDGLKKADDTNLWGKYRVCYGPQSYYWGGTWMCGAAGSDDTALIKQTMTDLTVDGDIMTKITKDTQDYTNNSVAMEAIGNDSTYGSDFLGGQNHIKLFTEAAKNINMDYLSPYDQGCNEKFQEAMSDYFTGNVSYSAAVANFKTKLQAVYSDVTFDSTFDAAIDA